MEDLNDAKTISQMEYSTQFFGFSPDAFVDTLTGVATNICEENLKSAQRHILKCFEGKVTEEELERSFERITERYTEGTEKVFLKFGRFIKNNLLLVPESVALPEDKDRPQTAAADEADRVAAENKLTRLRAALTHSKLKRAVLAGKVRRLQQVRERQKKLVRDAHNARNASRAVSVFCAEIQEVQSVKDSLRPVLEEGCNQEQLSCCGIKRNLERESDQPIATKKMKIA